MVICDIKIRVSGQWHSLERLVQKLFLPKGDKHTGVVVLQVVRYNHLVFTSQKLLLGPVGYPAPHGRAEGRQRNTDG